MADQAQISCSDARENDTLIVARPKQFREEVNVILSAHNDDYQLEQLNAELKATRSDLQATIEELETANQALKVSNEKVHSVNERLCARERQQVVIAELSHFALAGSDLDELLKLTCQRLAQVLDVALTKILEVLPDGDQLLLRAGHGWHAGLVDEHRVSAREDWQAGYTLGSAAAVVVENLSTETRFIGPTLLLEHQVVSGMSVVIGSVESPWGVLSVHTTEPQSFTADDMNFLQSVANLVFLAIEHQRSVSALQESQRRYQLVADAMPVLIAYFDRDLIYRFCNATYKAWFAIDPQEIVGKTLTQVFGIEAFRTFEPYCRRALAGERLSFDQEFSYHPGPHRHVRVDYVPDLDENDGVIGYYAMIRDITERKKSEQILYDAKAVLEQQVTERTRELRILADNVPDFFAYIDRQLRYRFLNHTYEEKFIWQRDEYLDRPVADALPAEIYAQLEPRLKAALEGKSQTFELNIDLPSDGPRVLRIRYVPHQSLGEGYFSDGVFALASDITEERRLQHDVFNAVEYEKARIGRDLHDSVCQEMGGAGMFSQALAKSLVRRNATEADEAEQLVVLINQTTQRARKLAQGLSPVVLEDRTLAEALAELTIHFNGLVDSVECHFSDRLGDLELSNSVATQLYFIAREAVYNAIRHGSPNSIGITLECIANQIKLSVSDDGGGRIEEMEEGLGLRSMRYRARTFGGALEITDRASDANGCGIVVTCTFQMPAATP